MMDLSGHAALVTGSTSGVGRAIAIALAKAGADLVLHGREDEAAAQEPMARCREAGVNVSYIRVDLGASTEQAVRDVFEQAMGAQPKLDILVNNAGHNIDVPFDQMTVDHFERTIRLNVQAGYFLTQAFSRHWVERGIHGRVLFTGSINGRLGEADCTAYDTSKGAVEMMVKTLCIALAPKGIRVNGLAPGLVHSSATTFLKDEPHKRDWIAHHTPNGRIPEPDVCGGGAVYLLSDEAEHTHGQMLLVDGGMSAWQQPPEPPKG